MTRPTVHGISIDPNGSRDLDDAVWIDDGDLLVSIADLSPWVRAGGPIDMTAQARVATRYLADGDEPMLPRRLSKDKASLLGSGRPTLTVRLCHPVEVQFTTLQSEGQWTYEEAAMHMREGHPMLLALYRMALNLFHARRQRGALAVFDPARGILSGEDGRLHEFPHAEVGAHLLVQEAMIAANVALAQLMAEADVPILFRNQRAAAVAGRVEGLQEDIDSMLNRPDLLSVTTLEERMALVVRRASYGATVEGHYALNLPVYAHFTSPLRRYPDLVNQRILQAWMDRQPSPYPSDKLEQLALHINTVLEQRREEKKVHFRAVDVSQTARLMQHASMAELDVDAFHKVLKHAIESRSITDTLDRAVARRCEQDLLTPRDYHRLLLHTPADAPWPGLREMAYAALVRTPAHATTVLQLATQQDRWPAPEWEERQTGPSHAPCFEARGHLVLKGEKFVSEYLTAGSRKAAQQRAAVALVGLVAGMPAESLPDAWHGQADDELPAPRAPSNAKNLLQERCQKKGWPMPQFIVSHSGPQHSLVFTARAVLQDLVSAACTGSNRKEAELGAANNLLRMLPPEVEEPTPVTSGDGNFVGALGEYCVRHGSAAPVYEITGDGPLFTCTVHAMGVSAEAQGQGKQGARREAARLLLSMVSGP